MNEISPIIREKAPIILAEIQKAKSVLLHCHPSPDPDSVGSALAMKFALEQMGKKVTVIKGDSEIPQAFMHFPGAGEIVQKNFFEVDLKEFDLFIIVDSASPEQVSRFKPMNFPLPIRTIVIDHHRTNAGFADVNLIEPDYPATGQILFELLSLLNVELTKDIASNLFIALYTDSGGLKYESTTPKTFIIGSKLAEIVPDFSSLVSRMENSRSPSEIRMQGLALSSIETFLNGKLALSLVSADMIKEKNIPVKYARAGEVSPILNSVSDWEISGVLLAVDQNKVRASFRTHGQNNYDVSKLAAAFGGGGHRCAAGATLIMPLEEAKKLVVSKAKELYDL